jgi:O-antigen/teichoic acid export membrane protein
VGNGIWSSLNTVSNLLNNGFDILVTNWMLAPLRMGQLAVVQSISIIYITIYTMVSPAFQPMILKCYSHDEHDEMMRWFYLAMKTSSMLCSLFFAGFFALGSVFYRLWIPNQDTELLYRLTVIAVIPAISGGIIAPMYYSYTLKVKKMIPFFFSAACGLLNVATMLVLLKTTDLELYAVCGTTAVYLVGNHLISNALYVCHILAEPKRLFYGKVLRCLMATAVMTAALKLLAAIISPDGWISLIACGVMCCAIGAPVYFMTGFDSSERAGIIEIIRKRKA